MAMEPQDAASDSESIVKTGEPGLAQALSPRSEKDDDPESPQTRRRQDTHLDLDLDLRKDEYGAESNQDPLELSLRNMLRARCFVGFETRTTTYLYTMQLTHSSVVSTVVTPRAFSLKRRQQALQTPPSSSNGSSVANARRFEGSRNQDSASGGSLAGHVYGQPCNPKKVRNQQKGKYQAQLPAFRRSLPALPIPVARLNQELVLERDKFMAQLNKEREEKTLLENWAATKIQACYRGYKSRPRLVSFQFRRQLNSLRAIRLDVRVARGSLGSPKWLLQELLQVVLTWWLWCMRTLYSCSSQTWTKL